MDAIGVVDFGSYLPEKRIEAEYFELEDDPLTNSPLFRAPRHRHHRHPDERAAAMAERAARPMFSRLGLDPSREIDAIITNVLLPDVLITGCGAELAHRLDCRPEWIVDLHNGGCASFAYMLKLAQKLLDGVAVRRALLVNVQNTAGSVFSQPGLRGMPQVAVPGDGCGVAYVVAGAGSPLLGVEVCHEPHHSVDMDLTTQCGRRYWEPGTGALNVKFDDAKFKEIIDRGNKLVPRVVCDLCERIEVDSSSIDVLVTNQPNRLFLKNWQTALGVDASRHLDTFDRFGNLYGAGVPITLDHASRDGAITPGALVVVAGFAHAGDLAAAAALRWRATG